ncbi:MAG: hypothetical protein AB7S38_12960 [Vulcanimicrobiota bacterium]
MVVKMGPDQIFKTGFVRIERKPGESNEQFDATKDQAVFPSEGQEHKLELDGKVDDVILKGLNPGYGQSLITELSELAPHAAKIAAACKASEAFLATAEVDLGTGSSWWVIPSYNTQHEITSYDLLAGPGPQKLNVRFAEGGLDVIVSSDDKQRDLGHAMRGLIAADGSVTPTLEGVSWKLAD